jgi:hypothetical protein
VKEDMIGKSLMGEDHSFGRRKNFEGRIYFCGRFFCGDLWCEEFGFGGFSLIRSSGHRFAGGFGHGGQDILTVSWS